MKTKLLLLLFLPLLGVAQGPINSYYGTDGVVFSILNPAGINHMPTGANVAWNFVNLSEIGTSLDTERTPTAAESNDFPGTTNVVSTVSSIDGVDSEFNVYSKHPGEVLSITGIQNSGLLLNYNTNNATLGLFPMEYGFSNSDAIAGNYDNGEYAGTFTGTVTTNADAWGTLTISGTSDINPFAGLVTRLKTVQNLSLNYSIFNNIGTVTVTTYSYYGTTLVPSGTPHFRTTVTTINVPLLSLDQTLVQHEAYKGALLSTTESQLTSNDLRIAPNPVADVLMIGSGDHKICSVILTDLTGKLVLKSESALDMIDVASLQKGLYFATISTDKGTSTQKFIKK